MKDPLEEAGSDVTRARRRRLAPAGPARPDRSSRSCARRRIDTLAIIVGIVTLIMLHEAGHSSRPKQSGMKVTEFFLGFGPRIWSFRQGETEYGVKAIPAGGYVRIIGMSNLEEVDPEDEPRTFRHGTFRQPAHGRSSPASP